MGIVDKVKELAGRSGESAFEYECEQCGAAFTDEARNPGAVSCPGCGSGRVYSPV
jgi:DNA-directed RNA polymerase subunit RPC12/RpoP